MQKISRFTAFSLWLAPVLVLALIVVPGLVINVAVHAADGYIPVLQVKGDVTQPLFVENMQHFTEKEIDYKNRKLNVLELKELLAQAEPLTKNYTIFLQGKDGLTATLDSKSIERSYLTFSNENGWETINLNHPVSSNIKDLEAIIIVSNEPLWDYGVNVITPEANLLNITPGQLYTRPYIVSPQYEGTSTVEKNGQVYSTSVYTRHRWIKPEDLLDLSKSKNIFIIGEAGKMLKHQKGMLELRENSVDYVIPETKARLHNVEGIVLEAPIARNSDAFYDTQHYLESGQRVLVIILDGFGYHQYMYSRNNAQAPFLQSLTIAEKAMTVYQPVTNAGLATIFTGTTPDVNGVHSRKQREMLVPDIFALANQLGKKSVYIEGNIKILKTGVEPELHLDENSNGSFEDEIFNSALSHLKIMPDLLVVHFHSIDDMGHRYGDLARETLAQIQKIDEYTRQLVEGWAGKVIITADHGMHTVPEGGSHGSVRYEDWFIPYIITEGGLKK